MYWQCLFLCFPWVLLTPVLCLGRVVRFRLMRGREEEWRKWQAKKKHAVLVSTALLHPYLPVSVSARPGNARGRAWPATPVCWVAYVVVVYSVSCHPTPCWERLESVPEETLKMTINYYYENDNKLLL